MLLILKHSCKSFVVRFAAFLTGWGGVLAKFHFFIKMRTLFLVKSAIFPLRFHPTTGNGRHAGAFVVAQGNSSGRTGH